MSISKFFLPKVVTGGGQTEWWLAGHFENRHEKTTEKTLGGDLAKINGLLFAEKRETGCDSRNNRTVNTATNENN